MAVDVEGNCVLVPEGDECKLNCLQWSRVVVMTVNMLIYVTIKFLAGFCRTGLEWTLLEFK